MAKRGTSGSGSLDHYLREISAYRIPTREEERELGRRIRAGSAEAVNELATRNLRFVVAMARRYRDRGVSVADLVNEGNVGLLRAARRYDERRGVRFVTYAAWWVRQSILEALRRQGELVPAPRSAGTRRRRRAYVFLDAASPDGGRRAVLDRLGDARGASADRKAEEGALRELIERCMATLPEREARVLRRYYGLDGAPAAGLQELSLEMGVSRGRVRQLRDQALQRLRAGPGRRSLATHRT